MNRTVKLLVNGGLIAIATLLAGMAIAKLFTARQVAQQMAISEGYLAKYPPQVTSDQVKQIDQRLKAMGLSTIEPSTHVVSPRQREVTAALTDYFDTLHTLEAGPLPPLPVMVTEHLAQQENGLEQLQALLQTQPSWAFDAGAIVNPDPGTSSGPNYSSIIALHSHLLAQSILAYQTGDRTGQAAAFNAAVNLTQSMAANHSLTAHILVTVSARNDIAVARHTNLALTPRDYGQPLITAAALDTHIWYIRSINTFRKQPLGALSGIGYQYLLALPFTDLLLLTQTNEQKLHNSFYQQLTSARLCTVDGNTLPQSYAITPYAVPLRVFHQHVANALSMELNTLITEAQQTYRETGRWPTVLASKDSHVCSSVTWHYRMAQDGISITFDGALPWLDQQDPPMPLSYTITSKEMGSSPDKLTKKKETALRKK
ncbi:MAG: hypothetical protein AAFU84_13695 [Cyanobacteria bacterium J06633_23]